MRKLKPSTIYILKGLIPYTDPNLKLSFKPNAFFNELERITREQERKQDWINASSYKQQYYRLKKKGLFTTNKDGTHTLTELGKLHLEFFKPEILKDALLLVTFDIQERLRPKRDEFRSLLRVLKFKQVQKSVWISKYDSRKVLSKEINRLNLQDSVVVYEARDITN